MTVRTFTTPSAIVNVMIRAAFKAGRGLVRDFGEVEHLQISRKGPGDFVSTADRRAEKLLWGELSKARPEFGFLMEESGEIPGKGGRWIIDPLDGTMNFLHGVPHFAISIALQQGRDITHACIYDPLRDEVFWAEKGSGAFCHERRLRVSSRKYVDEALVGLGVPRIFHREDVERYQLHVGSLIAHGARVRNGGSAALDLAYVASGRLEAFWQKKISIWDIAAGILLVREAGGLVSDFAQGGQMLEKGEILATNASLFNGFYQLIQSQSRDGNEASP